MEVLKKSVCLNLDELTINVIKRISSEEKISQSAAVRKMAIEINERMNERTQEGIKGGINNNGLSGLSG